MNDGFKRVLCIASILIAVLAVYSNCFQGAFVYDDHINIVNSQQIHTLSGAVTATSRPVTNISFWLHFATGMTHRADFHAINLILHLLNAIFLWLLVWEFSRYVAAGKRLFLTTAVVSLWALHPIHTESVTYIVQRAELLGLLFMLSGLNLGLRCVRTGKRLCSLGVALCFALAYLCKPTTVCAPFLMLLLDASTVSGGVGKAIRRNYVLHGIGLLTLAVPAFILSGHHESATSAGFSTGILSFWQYLAFQPKALLFSVWKLLWPSRLVIDYGFDLAHEWTVVFAAITMVVLLAATVWRAGRCGGPAHLGLAWFFIAAAPMLLVPLVDLFTEHRTYIPSIGAALILGSVLVEARAMLSKHCGARVGLIACSCVIVLVGCSLGARTYMRNSDYSDPAVLWRQVVEQNPSNVRGYLGMGSMAAARGDMVSAEGDFRMGVKVYEQLKGSFLKESHRTDYGYACRNLGEILLARGLDAEASVYLLKADKAISDFR
jgi:hypothetical protein